MRKKLLSLVATVATAGLLLSACGTDSDNNDGNGASSSEDIQLVLSMRDISNPYHVAMQEGAQLFADTVDAELTVLANDADSQKQMSQIQTLVAGGGKFALVVEAQTSSDARPIVQAVENAGGSVVTLMNKTEDIWPEDVGDSWVSHITFDNVQSGNDIAEALFDDIGGSGSIIALRGVLDTPTDQDRYAGLEQALENNTDVKVLDVQTAGFARAEGFSVTQSLLNKYGDEVDGIWASNDDMALGAIEALREANLYGEISVVGVDGTPEAIELIADEESGFVATVDPSGAWQAGAGLALAYQAASGELDVSSLDIADRSFNAEQFLVTSDNAQSFLETPTLSDLEADFEDPFARKTGPIEH